MPPSPARIHSLAEPRAPPVTAAPAGDQPFSEACPEDAPAPGGRRSAARAGERPWSVPEEAGLRITPEMIKRFSEEAMELEGRRVSAAGAGEDAGRRIRRAGLLGLSQHQGQRRLFWLRGSRGQATWLKTCWIEIRNGEPVCDPATMSVLLKVVDAVRSKIGDLSLEGGGEITDIDELCDRLVHLVEDREPACGIRRQKRSEAGKKMRTSGRQADTDEDIQPLIRHPTSGIRHPILRGDKTEGRNQDLKAIIEGMPASHPTSDLAASEAGYGGFRRPLWRRSWNSSERGMRSLIAV